MTAGTYLVNMRIYRMEVDARDRRGATETNGTQIQAIDALDALGYRGRGREEHSGENAPREADDLVSEIADNATDQL